MTSEGSKRRDFLSLVFITKSISKRLLLNNPSPLVMQRLQAKVKNQHKEEKFLEVFKVEG